MSIRTRALTGLALLLTMSACADESTPAANGAGVSLRGPHENILLSVDPDAPEPEVLDLASVLSEEEIASLARDQDKTLFAASSRNRVANSGVSPSGSPITGANTWVDKLYALNTGEATLSGVAYNTGTTITSGIKSNIDTWAAAVWR
jgi:hypothetical protein